MTRHRKHVRALRDGQKAPLQMIQRTEHQGITGEETEILAKKGRSFGRNEKLSASGKEQQTQVKVLERTRYKRS